MSNEALLKLLGKDSGSQYKQTIETLMAMQDEDRMSLFTVLSIAVAYLNGHEMSPTEINKQQITINNILERYEIYSMKILNQKVEECATNLRCNGLIRQPPLGGIQ